MVGISDIACCSVGVIFDGKPVAVIACTMASTGGPSFGNSGSIGIVVVDTLESIVVDGAVTNVGAVADQPPVSDG